MENWEYKLAELFKDRDNPKPLGACIGKVESLAPVIISIQDGKFMLQAEQIYICNQILERETTFRDYVANQSQSGNISVSCTHGGGSYSANGDIEASGRVHLNEVWKVGDYVMVVPDKKRTALLYCRYSERGELMFPSDVDFDVPLQADTSDDGQRQGTIGRSIAFDYEKNEFVVNDGKLVEPGKIDAIKQWIELYIRIEINKYAIYTESFGVDTRGLMGYRLPRGYQVAEIMRRINEGILTQCPDVVSVSNWDFNKGTFSFTVKTNTGEEVVINVE